MVSRMPPISPARTSWVKSSSKTLGCWESASAKVEPDSTRTFTSVSTRRNSRLSAWVAMISSPCTSGRPASIITENCRVKMRMSLVVTPPNPGILMLISRGFLFTLTGSSPICARRAFTAPSSLASISPERTSPWRLFASHFHTGSFRTAGAFLVPILVVAACAMSPSLLIPVPRV